MKLKESIYKMPGHTGQHAPRAMFTDEDVEAIRELRQEGVSAMELAVRFRCNVTTIHRIISKRTYKPSSPKSAHKNTPVSQAGAQ